MPNKVENNGVVTHTDKVYYNAQDIQGEMMRYRVNSLSYKLGMFAIGFSILAAFISLNSLAWNYSVIFKILLNIVLLLFGFLSIEKVKAYSLKSAYILVGFGVVCIARIFWCPLRLIIDYSAFLKDNTQVGSLGPVITGDYLTNAYLPMDGYFRGYAAIVLLACAAAFFIASGVIGIIRSKKYTAFIATQDTSKGV